MPASLKIPAVLGRRELVRAAAGALVAAACGETRDGARGGPVSAAAAGRGLASRRSRPRSADDFRGPVELHSWFDLPPRDPRSHELSGIAWDAPRRTLWAIQDGRAQLVPIVPDAALRTWTFGPPTPLDIDAPFDLEGLVLAQDVMFVCSEVGPRIYELDRAGRRRRELPLPAHFLTARTNKSLESLALAPGHRYLFTTSESALGCDGLLATEAAGARVRLLRLDLQTLASTEHAYETDAAGHAEADHGVAELIALSEVDLLVLERGFAPGAGNTVRIYATSLADIAACTAAPRLEPTVTALRKTLLVDLETLDARGVPPARQPQRSPLLDNYEAMAVGPDLPDGRPTLLVVSDDNDRAVQTARILVLAVGGHR